MDKRQSRTTRTRSKAGDEKRAKLLRVRVISVLLAELHKLTQLSLTGLQSLRKQSIAPTALGVRTVSLFEFVPRCVRAPRSRTQRPRCREPAPSSKPSQYTFACSSKMAIADVGRASLPLHWESGRSAFSSSYPDVCGLRDARSAAEGQDVASLRRAQSRVSTRLPARARWPSLMSLLYPSFLTFCFLAGCSASSSSSSAFSTSFLTEEARDER
jgi:hypothetical protein